MSGGMYFILAGFMVIIIVMGLKIYYLKKSAKEIHRSFSEKIDYNTNTLIHISSHDKDMKELASALNIQLKSFHQSRQKYEHGDLELKEAITNISHDLRTPLTAIYGYVNLLKKEECTEEAQNYLMAIENRTHALKQLTEELFHYTMAVSAAEEMPLEIIPINGVLENSISTFYTSLIQKNITPQISMPEEIIRCRANRDALSRVFENIIGNAVKYSDGDLEITLMKDGEILFSNHVSGMTEVQIERLFDRFYTVNNARKSTGLGLSIAKALVEKMGGAISADYSRGLLRIRIKFPEI